MHLPPSHVLVLDGFHFPLPVFPGDDRAALDLFVMVDLQGVGKLTQQLLLSDQVWTLTHFSRIAYAYCISVLGKTSKTEVLQQPSEPHVKPI